MMVTVKKNDISCLKFKVRQLSLLYFCGVHHSTSEQVDAGHMISRVSLLGGGGE